MYREEPVLSGNPGTAADRPMPASASSSNLRGPSPESEWDGDDDVNITVDSGEPHPGAGSSEWVGTFRDAEMPWPQHHDNSSYVNDVPPNLRVFTSRYSTPHLQEGPLTPTYSEEDLSCGSPSEEKASTDNAGDITFALSSSSHGDPSHNTAAQQTTMTAEVRADKSFEGSPSPRSVSTALSMLRQLDPSTDSDVRPQSLQDPSHVRAQKRKASSPPSPSLEF